MMKRPVSLLYGNGAFFISISYDKKFHPPLLFSRRGVRYLFPKKLILLLFQIQKWKLLLQLQAPLQISGIKFFG